ncbi:hypothetical protein PFISCL1PPCAC_19525, partial [Pristionchus fissidentatus]
FLLDSSGRSSICSFSPQEHSRTSNLRLPIENIRLKCLQDHLISRMVELSGYLNIESMVEESGSIGGSKCRIVCWNELISIRKKTNIDFI